MQKTSESVSCHAFIGGAWVKGEKANVDVISPVSGTKIGEYSIPSKTQIDRAIQIADQAQKEWALLPIKERSKILFNFRNILTRDIDSIAKLKGSESGKIFAEAKAGLMKGIEVLEFALS